MIQGESVRSWRDRIDGLLVGSPWAVVVGAALGFLLVAAVWQSGWLRAPQEYTEPVVGRMAWRAASKSQDFRAFALLLVAVPASVLLANAWVARVRRVGGPEAARAVDGWMQWLLVPVGLWLGACLACGFIAPHPALLAWLIGGLVWLVSLAERGEASRYTRHGRIVALGLAAVAAAWLSGSAVALVCFRTSVDAWWMPYLTAGAAFLAILGVTWGRGNSQQLERAIEAVALAGQLALPLLLVTLIPAPLVLADVDPVVYRGAALWSVVLGMIGLGWVEWGLRFRGWWRGDCSGGALFGSVGAVAAVVFLTRGGGYFPFLQPDFFHSGEQLLPWQQTVRFGLLPYTEAVPIHGLMPFLIGGLNEAFFGGTATGHQEANVLLGALAVVATFLAARGCAGVAGATAAALCVGLTVGPGWDRMAFLPAGLFLLAHPSLLARPSRWLAACLAVAAFQLAYNFAAGMAFGAAGGLWAVFYLARHGRGEWRGLCAIAVVVGVFGGLVLAVPSSRHVVRDFAAFLVENAEVNTVAHCGDWDPSCAAQAGDGIYSSRLLFQFRSHLWILLSLVLPGAVALWWARGRLAVFSWQGALAVCGPVSFCLLAPWALGRMDPGVEGRSAAVSYVAFSLALALFLRGPSSASIRPAVGLLAALALGLFVRDHSAALRDPPGYAARRATEVISPGKGMAYIDGSAEGMPALGTGIVFRRDLDRARALRDGLSEWLRPGETFLDWTNSQAYYYLLELPVPSAYPAFFTVASRALQGRVLGHLSRTNPPVVLVGPRGDLDGGSIALRSYFLFREYVLTRGFVPVERHGFCFLVDPARVGDADRPTALDHRRMLRQWLSPPNLEAVPLAWGQSAKIRNSLVPAGPGLPAGGVLGLAEARDGWYATADSLGVFLFDLRPLAMTGDLADLVEFEVELDRADGVPADAAMEVMWLVGPHWTGPLMFTGRCGRLLVPLSAHPDWLLAGRVDGLALRLKDAQRFRGVRARLVGFHRIRPPAGA